MIFVFLFLTSSLSMIISTYMCILSHSVAQSWLTLCNSMDYRPPGSSVHRISQARILEWVAISFFRGSSKPRDQTFISCITCLGSGFFTTEPPGKYPGSTRFCKWLYCILFDGWVIFHCVCGGGRVYVCVCV